MKFEIEPREVFLKLLYFIIALLILNVIGIIYKFNFDPDLIYGIIRLFDFNQEKNIPTFYSSLTFLVAGTLLLIIALKHKRNGSFYLSWLVLAIIFFFLSIDDFAMIHERIGMLLRKLINTSGVFYYPWVIPYGIFSILILIAYIKFLKNLPRNIMTLFLISGGIFVLSALGIEMLTAMLHELYGKDSLLYPFLYTCEEFLEMLGIIIFIYALLLYIKLQFNSLTITIK